MAARSQQKVAQIGVLVLTNADGQSLTRELRLGLRDLGFSESQNFVFQLRSADGDKKDFVCTNEGGMTVCREQRTQWDCTIVEGSQA